MAVRLPHSSQAGPARLTLLVSGLVLVLLISIYSQLNEQGRMLRQLTAAQACTATAAAAAQVSGAQAGQEVKAAVTAQANKPKAVQAVAKKDAKPIPTLHHRTDIAQLLQSEGLTTGAELGVLIGDFAEHTLKVWQGCTKYYLVDLWAQQENYKDLANSGDTEQEMRYKQTQERLAPWKDKTAYLRMYTTEGAKKIPDNSLDYVYVDARHDYCGVMEDLVAYWPKLRSGGIFAGHDYIDAHDKALKETNQDWSVCMDGTINFGAVKGAVDTFSAAHGLTVVTTQSDGLWPTWLARKP